MQMKHAITGSDTSLSCVNYMHVGFLICVQWYIDLHMFEIWRIPAASVFQIKFNMTSRGLLVQATVPCKNTATLGVDFLCVQKQYNKAIRDLRTVGGINRYLAETVF